MQTLLGSALTSLFLLACGDVAKNEPPFVGDGGLTYSDPSCSREAAALAVNPCTGEEPNADDVVAIVTDECTGVATTRGLLPVAQSAGFQLTDQGCIPSPATNERERIHAVGDVLDPSTHPLLEEVTH